MNSFSNFSSSFNRRDFVRTAAVGATIGLAARATAAMSPSGAEAAVPADASLLLPLPDPKAAPSSSGVALAPPDRQPAKLKVPTPVKRKIGWAVVGLGELAVEESLPAFKQCEYSRIVALVSGHQEKAAKIAEVYQVKSSAIYDYAGFDRIAENPEIDAVYIVLPNSMHAEFTVRALRAGKHVLCEKPMATSVAECEQMIAAAKKADRLLGIAYRLHHEPHTLMAMDLCRRKAFGEIKQFSSANCQTTGAPNIRLSAATGGGPVSDVGVYSINAARSMTNEEPVEVTAMAHWGNGDPQFREVPQSVSYLMRFPSGILASCECSFGTARSSRLRVLGTKGFVEMDPAFPYEGQTLKLSEQPSEDADPRTTQFELKAVNQFKAEFDYFARCILDHKEPKTPGETGLADLRVVLAIQESIRTGKTVRVG